MLPLGTWLERVFAWSDKLQAHLSDRWKLHANRRTIVILLLAGSILISGYVYVVQPPENFPVDELVTVQSGDTLTQISNTLQSDGVIRSALAFRAIVMILGYERGVHAGDYLFKEPRDIWSVARAMSVGSFGLEPMRIRIPEGATTKRMSIIFASRLQRFNQANFLAQAQPAEGYLFPDTYFFMPNATEDTVIQAMRQNFDSKIEPLMPAIASSTRSLADIVTMASIVEREAYNTTDRKLIAGVLWNRIKKDMPLQVDVTFLYTLGKGTFQLTMNDLRTPSPYNTYINKGLPPTPIGSPSLDSLNATLNYTPNDYLYFLADHSGVTHFCKTYTCHLANKRRYY